MDVESNKLGGDFVAPDASTEAKRFILASRAMLYAGEPGREGEAIRRAITGSQSLVDGAVPILAMVIENVESKIGQLSEQDLWVAVNHLAGTIVEVALAEGDPEAMAEDGRTATEEIADGVMQVLTGGAGQPMAPEQPMQAQGPRPLLEA